MDVTASTLHTSPLSATERCNHSRATLLSFASLVRARHSTRTGGRTSCVCRILLELPTGSAGWERVRTARTPNASQRHRRRSCAQRVALHPGLYSFLYSCRTPLHLTHVRRSGLQSLYSSTALYSPLQPSTALQLYIALQYTSSTTPLCRRLLGSARHCGLASISESGKCEESTNLDVSPR